MPVALVFVDGVGIGARDPSRNPLARRATLLSHFDDTTGEPLPAGGVMTPLDVRMGVAGRPQSATGHTALLTGENAPALLGKHLLGYPNLKLRELLERQSIFRRLRDLGRTFLFANGYPATYLEAIGLPHHGPPSGLEIPAQLRRKLRPAAAPFAFAAAGGVLSTFAQVADGRALTHDLTGAAARDRGMDVPVRTPAQAAEIFASLAASTDFTMLDYFQTDDAGHARDFEAADRALADLDAFLRSLVDLLPLERHSLVVVSDHGNLEDLSSRNHTLADVALLRFGPATRQPAPARLDQVMPLLLSEAQT